jgi:hypothetical protein
VGLLVSTLAAAAAVDRPTVRNVDRSLTTTVASGGIQYEADDSSWVSIDATMVLVAKEGSHAGRVISAVVPDANQIAEWGL